MACGEGIGFELVSSRRKAGQRLQQEREHRQHEEEQHEGNTVRLRNRRHPETLVEPGLCSEMAQQCQPGQTEHEADQHALQDVSVLEMAQFMGQDRFDFLARQT